MLSLALTLFAQQPASPAASDDRFERVWERLEQFETAERAEMAHWVLAHVLTGDHPKLRHLQRLREAETAPPVREEDDFRVFDADEYAPALGLRTRTIEPDDRAWQRFAERYGVDPERDLRATWRWSAGQDVLLAPRERSSPEQRLRALADGRLPEPDRFVAEIQAALGQDEEMRVLADYFQHGYRDRDGRVYVGLRLEDMWRSGREFGISDVEAVAYLRRVLGDDSIRSPIPKRKHDGIYSMIRDDFARWREAHDLRRALAAVYFHPRVELPKLLKPLAPRLDLAWALVDDDPQRMRAWLERHDTRQAFLAEVEAVIAARTEQGESEDAIRARRAPLAPLIVHLTAEGMRREGLLGVR